MKPVIEVNTRMTLRNVTNGHCAFDNEVTLIIEVDDEVALDRFKVNELGEFSLDDDELDILTELIHNTFNETISNTPDLLSIIENAPASEPIASNVEILQYRRLRITIH